MHDDAKTWADAGALKVKYSVHAENFKRILEREGLIFLKNFMIPVQSLKRELLNDVEQHRG